jgi:VanZ family protein
MKQNLQKYVRDYPYSVLIIVVIWLLSLLPFFPETPLDDVPFIDKWTHFVMYGTLSLTIWYEYRRHHSRPCYRHLFFWGWLAPIAMSGLLELLQEYATVTRSGEWTDWAANATGATIGSVLGLLLLRL